MATQLEICNLALRHLGMKKITSLSDTDPVSVACNDLYNHCRDDVFREFKWPFATIQATLTASSIDEPLGWEYVYEYPTLPVATIWCVFNEATLDEKDNQDFQIYYDVSTATKVVCSNLDEVYYEATYILDDESMWDSKFCMALSYRLSAELAPVLNADAEKVAIASQIYNNILSEAKRISSYEKLRKPTQKSSYQSAR